MTPGPRRQLAIAHGAQLPAQRLLGDDDAELLEHPLAEIDDPPAHDAVNRWNRATLDDRRQCGSMVVIQARLRSRRFAIGYTNGPYA